MAADVRPRAMPEITRNAYPLVSAFLRGYLHQDWMMDYESAVHARDAFLQDAAAEEREAFVREGTRLVQVVGDLSPSAIGTLLADRLGGAWMPERASDVRAVFLLPASHGRSDQ